MSKKRPNSQTFTKSPKLTMALSSCGGSQLLMKDRSKVVELKRIEEMLKKMQSKKDGVPIKSVSNIFHKISGVFSGEDMVHWLINGDKSFDFQTEREATHFGSMIASHGYFFPIDDHILSLKNDKSQLYRFQDPHYWPTIRNNYDNKDYAIYLCKRSLQNKARLELTDHEQENLVKLKNSYHKCWAEIYNHAKAQAKMESAVHDKSQRKLQEGQEKAFWNMLKPVPGSVRVFEIDLKKAEQADKNYPTSNAHSLRDLRQELEMVKVRLTKHAVKKSNAYTHLINYITPRQSYDPFLQEVYDSRQQSCKISFDELLRDDRAREEFERFLEKEYSAENLKFWLLCKAFKGEPVHNLKSMAYEIHHQFIGSKSKSPVNLESKTKWQIEDRMQHKIDRYCFEDAQKHIHQLMKRDSYERFLKSKQYEDFITKVSQKPLVRFHW